MSAPTRSQPGRNKRNTNPARIQGIMPAPRRTSAQKKADDELVALAKLAAEGTAVLTEAESVRALAKLEDKYRHDDMNIKAWRRSTAPPMPSGPRKRGAPTCEATPPVEPSHDEDEDGKFHELAKHVQYQMKSFAEPAGPADAGQGFSSPGPASDATYQDELMDEDEDDGPSPDPSKPEESDKVAHHKKKAPAAGKAVKAGKHSVRATVLQARTTQPATATPHAIKKRKHTTSEAPPAMQKRSKMSTPRASNLKPQWRQLSSSVIAAVALTNAPSSSKTQKPEATPDTEDPESPGEFDEDEDPAALEAAWGNKVTNIRGPKERTTAQMGLKLESVGAAAAVKAIDTKAVATKKSYSKLKFADLPFDTRDPVAIARWHQAIRSVIDWAGTCDDPFGTNEHVDFANALQSAWDEEFPDLELNVKDEENAAIVKLACDHLNNWRSGMGKRAVALVEQIMNSGPYANDTSARVKWVASQLPGDDGDFVPFIWEDPQAKSGSWSSALMRDVLAWHVKRTQSSSLTFGRPTGALAAAAAAVERAITLMQMGQVTRDYFQSTNSLTDTKWDKIMGCLATHESAAPPAAIERATKSSARANVMVSDDEA
ncbi:hypothetical protein OF83DRAFT_1174448 [Amylostereum chailletii]|nr:hypothetical protein OF83DRAFT_1174448 [Amylostereum chailletii]